MRIFERQAEKQVLAFRKEYIGPKITYIFIIHRTEKVATLLTTFQFSLKTTGIICANSLCAASFYPQFFFCMVAFVLGNKMKFFFLDIFSRIQA